MTRSRLDAVAIWSGLIGATVMTLGALLTGIVYRGKAGETYMPFSHWVSELGERGVSQLAPAFNVSLMIGGILFAVFMTGLAVPMAIGRVCLDDGRDVLGFLCEPAAVRGAADITRFGGWRAWIGRHAAV